MFMGRDWKYWAMVVGFMALGTLWMTFKPEYREKHKELLLEQFHLSEDVEFEVLHSDFRSKHSREQAVAIVQFTPGQYNNYMRSLDDSSLWSMQSFEWFDVDVDSSAPSGAMTWWDKSDAFHDGSSYPHWLGWGHEHGEVVFDVEAHRSFCFGVLGEGSAQRIYQCGDMQDERPDVYVRGMIDAEGQRLFALISN